MFGNSAEYPETHEDISTCEAADYDPRSRKERHERQPGGVIEALRTASQQADAKTDEREAFEQWYAALPNNGRKAGLTLLDAWQARAILALRPAAAPMTDEHLSVLKEMADRCPELNLRNYDSDDVDELNSWAVEIAVYIDGITAQAKEGGAA